VADAALVTGGAGFIGSRIVQALLDEGRDVTIVDNLSRVTADDELARLLDQAELVEHDRRQPAPEQLRGRAYSDIYHFVALLGTGRVAAAPQEVLRLNLLATINLLEYAATCGAERVFFSSTSEVTDGAVALGVSEAPVTESAPLIIPDVTVPRASYAISKIAGESLMLAHAAKVGFAARIGRYFNVYGPRMGTDHVIPQLVERIRQREQPFRIFGAYQRRAFCHVSDAVTGTLALMSVTGADPIIANIGNELEELEIMDLARRLFELAEFSPELDVRPPPLGSPERRCPSTLMMRSLTGYEPRVSLAEGLAETYAWYADERHAVESRGAS
jgi:UDP-glucose 4-epimerase/UDP-glucuronate decarboxylase